MESGLQLKESGILPKIGIQNLSSTDKDWNPVPGNPKSTAWDPESKTVLDSLTWGELIIEIFLNFLTFIKFNSYNCCLFIFFIYISECQNYVTKS